MNKFVLEKLKYMLNMEQRDGNKKGDKKLPFMKIFQKKQQLRIDVTRTMTPVLKYLDTQLEILSDYLYYDVFKRLLK
jgi:alpha-D-ribose 1-methylphosphonate 5-triphosphate synthase subunit PhnI